MSITNPKPPRPELVEAIKANSHLERIALALQDALAELRSVNEGLRWQQEYFKNRTQEIQEALAERESEATRWQQTPEFAQEVERRVRQEVTERLMQLDQGLPVKPIKPLPSEPAGESLP